MKPLESVNYALSIPYSNGEALGMPGKVGLSGVGRAYVDIWSHCFPKDKLDLERATELRDKMLAAGIPLWPKPPLVICR